MTTATKLDAHDTDILAERIHCFDLINGPRVGDYVQFADGVTRRIAYMWRDEEDRPFSVQTTDGGSFYLGQSYVSFSGSLNSGVEPATLTDTGRKVLGSVWIFHHDQRMAHNGVDTEIPFRLYTCTEIAPR